MTKIAATLLFVFSLPVFADNLPAQIGNEKESLVAPEVVIEMPAIEIELDLALEAPVQHVQMADRTESKDRVEIVTPDVVIEMPKVEIELDLSLDPPAQPLMIAANNQI